MSLSVGQAIADILIDAELARMRREKHESRMTDTNVTRPPRSDEEKRSGSSTRRPEGIVHRPRR